MAEQPFGRVRLIEMEEGDQVVAIEKLIERDDEVNGTPAAAGDPGAAPATAESAPEPADETPDE